MVEVGVAGGGELIAVVPVVCPNRLLLEVLVAPVGWFINPLEPNAPGKVLLLSPDGLDVSLVFVKAKAEARSDMKLLLFPPVEAALFAPGVVPEDCAFVSADCPSDELPILLENGTIELPANPVAWGTIGAGTPPAWPEG